VVLVTQQGQLASVEQFPRLRDALGNQGVDPAVFTLPDEVRSGDIDVDALLAGREDSGRSGDTVFLAQPIGSFGSGAREVAMAAVATDTIDTSVLRRAQPLLLVAAGIVLFLGVLLSVWLARRLSRPIAAIEDAARRIAAGDLSARADVPAGTDEELLALAETLNAMAARLESARDSERTFLLSVSHDLRTPLTSIRGYAEALADGTLDDGDPGARARAAEVITAEARRLERLVRDLLDLSRLDTHQFSFHPRPGNAAEIVRDAVAAFVPAAHDLGLTLEASGATDMPADVDPDRLAQIVANLVENALKFAGERVEVAIGSEGSSLTITVTDDGPGIPEPEMAHVFERLYTVRATPGRSVGTGLGLAIVRELAAAMGGRAYVAPAPTGGTRFVVTVPLGAAAPTTV
jgi:two-component system sensor histidine kinase BaeS